MKEQLALPLAPPPERVGLGRDAWLLPSFAAPFADSVRVALRSVLARAPLRQMFTPRGLRIAVAMTNCGALGWVSDEQGYRYEPRDPDTGEPWPRMPVALRALATSAAERAGFHGFSPDACLINCYSAGQRLGLHQDRDERDLTAPIVSVSLGLAATFLWGGDARTVRPRRVVVEHGDTIVWGASARLNFHGMAPVKPATHPFWGDKRVNLTFRRAG